MTIETHQPELEALIQQSMATGRFPSVEDVLITALRESHSAQVKQETTDTSAGVTAAPLGQRLVQACAMISGSADDVDFMRQISTWRDLDLS